MQRCLVSCAVCMLVFLTLLWNWIIIFTMRSCDPMSSVHPSVRLSVCSSVCLSVTLVDHNHIGWKSWRLIARTIFVQLLLHKCMPILFYGFEVCALDKRSLQSLDFTVNRLFMKLFRTSDISVMHYCQSLFAFDLPSITLARRFVKFCQLENMRVC